jgi:DNA replication protein DnaC
LKNLADRIWQKKLNNLFELSGLPKKYFEPQHLVRREVDAECWDWLEDVRNNIVEEVQRGLNIVITSTIVGNGKTSWAVRLLQRYLAETALDGRLVEKGMFVVSAQLLTEFGDYNYFQTMKEFLERFEKLKTCDLLVIDEIGGGSLNKASYPYLYDLVNYRVDNNLSTIYTTNYTDDEIIDLLGQRLYSRIYDTSVVLEFEASNVRGLEADEIELV